MQIDSRSSEVGGSRTLYTGLHNMKVIAINPTVAELEDMGYNPQFEPEYISVSEDGFQKAVVDVYFQSDEVSFPVKRRFWLENRINVTRDGNKTDYIDDYTANSYVTSVEELPTWVDQSTARQALVGEAQLLKFIAAWANINPFPDKEGNRAMCKFENIDKLFSNDTSEIRSIMTGEITKDNLVKLLLDVIVTEDGKKFQDVYPYFFDRAASRSTKMWVKRLGNDYTQCKGDYQNSLEFQEYTATAVTTPDVPDTKTEPTTEAPW